MGRRACLEVDPKVFATGGWNNGQASITFKVSSIASAIFGGYRRPSLIMIMD